MMDKFKEILENIWSYSFVRFIVYLAIAFAVAGLAKWLITKLLKLLKLDEKLDKWGINEGQVGTSLSFIGKLVYIIVFLLFFPAALNALGLASVSAPITGFVSTCIDYIPNIIAAALIIYVGAFLGKIIGQIVTVLLKKTKIDNLTKKIKNGDSSIVLSEIIGKIIFAVILIIAIVQGLTVLKIDAISAPALSIINAVFAAIPKILLAVIVVACGLLISSIVCGLIENLLKGVGFDGVVNKIIPGEKKVSATKVVTTIIKVVIILFVVAQGVDVLGLAVLTNVSNAVIAYLPQVLFAAIIACVAFVGGSMLEGFIVKAAPKAKSAAKLVKIAIYVLAGFMVFSQLGFATTIVNTAFIIIMSGIAIAFAIAFGIGGKDFAKKTLDKVDNKVDSLKSDDENK
ncbi:MAG: mechanosensitive ion channel [Eubacteriales bacterium]